MWAFFSSELDIHRDIQWNLNNPVTCGAVLLGCNKEVVGIQLTSTEYLYVTCKYTNMSAHTCRVHVWLRQEQVQARLFRSLYADTMSTTARSWTPVTTELFLFKREISNNHDPFAVAIWKDGEVVGHVPVSLSKITPCFLNYMAVTWYSVKLLDKVWIVSRTGNRSFPCLQVLRTPISH